MNKEYNSGFDTEDTVQLPVVEEEIIEQHHQVINENVRFSAARKAVCCILAVFAVIMTVCIYHEARTVQAESIQKTVEPAEEETVAEATPEPTPEPKPDLNILNEKLSASLADLQGEWSVYVEDLSTGESIAVNDHKQHSASLIKLFTAGRYEQALANGEIAATDASEYNEQMMISWSDNDAWVALETTIGQGSYYNGYTSVTQFARDNGFSATGRLVDLNDNWNGEGGMNWTSVNDVGHCLEMIYNNIYVSSEASQKILNLMLDQQHINKIPAGLPEGTQCANKTGELDLTQNDAAIVYGPTSTYILVVMSDGMYSDVEAINKIIEISTMVYNHMEMIEA